MDSDESGGTYSGVMPTTEICDGKDNDCDGNTDEGGVCPQTDGGDGGGSGDGGSGGGGVTIPGGCSCSAAAAGAGAFLLLGLWLAALRRRRG